MAPPPPLPISAPTITLIHSPPASISPSEHDSLTQTTPESFDSIPPVLRLKKDKVHLRAIPKVKGWEESGSGAVGTLFVTEAALSFLSNSNSNQIGISIPYPLITLHALSRTPTPASFNQTTTEKTTTTGTGVGTDRPSIYCQLEADPNGDGSDDPEGPSLLTKMKNGSSQSGPDEDEGGDDDYEPFREMWFVPEDENDLDQIFSSISHCASLHPSTGDPSADFGFPGLDLASMVTADDLNDDGDAEEEEYEDAEGEGDGEELATGVEQVGGRDEMTEAGKAALDYLESAIQWPSSATSNTTANASAEWRQTMEQGLFSEATKRKAEESLGISGGGGEVNGKNESNKKLRKGDDDEGQRGNIGEEEEKVADAPQDGTSA